MTLLVDTSVVLKWFHAEGESDVPQARALLDAHRAGSEQLLVLDLGIYELGNVLLRALRVPAAVVVEQLSCCGRSAAPSSTRVLPGTTRPRCWGSGTA